MVPIIETIVFLTDTEVHEKVEEKVKEVETKIEKDLAITDG